MFKLIALDLDGTLLTDKKKITRENLDTLHHLIELGYQVVIATGRSYYSARILTGNINEHLIYVCNNGNIVRDAIDDKVISAKYLNPEDSKIILEEGFARNLDPIIHVDYFESDYDIILEKNSYHAKRYKEESNKVIRAKIIEGQIENNLSKVLAMVYPGKLDILKDFHYSISELYPNKFNSHVMENIVMAEAMLEVMNPMGTKWNTLIEYATSLGIKAEEIITMGDDNNDIEMIMNAGLGIAMKNGSNLVKEVANRVSEKDNNQSGVAFELKRVLDI